MGYSIDNLAIRITERDTFCIPVAIKNHKAVATETFVFTIRRLVSQASTRGKMVLGDILFQKIVTYSDLTPIKDTAGVEVGCQFMVRANITETANIASCECCYDLALVDNYYKSEHELIPPSRFVVGEVLRYE